MAEATGSNIICIGDTMLDRFVYGSVDRISPEAPVPVFRQHRIDEMPGGAGNVARNVAALGAHAVLIGIVGCDEAGRQLEKAISGLEHIDGRLITAEARPTTLKTRYVATGQQVLRVDTEEAATITSATQRAVIEALHQHAKGAGAILISDYAKGVITEAVCRAIGDIAREHSIPVIVDPKGRDFRKYGDVAVIKPNAAELMAATGLPSYSDKDVAAGLVAAKNASRAKAIVVTRAEKGMSYLEDNADVIHLRGEAREVYDVSGAGDTSLAALGLGLAAGGPLEQAVALAIIASGLAVAKAGTAAVLYDELIEAIDRGSTAYNVAQTSLPSTLAKVNGWRDLNLRVGFTNGCFDILHPGHLKVLEEARARCDRLIVGLNSDTSVKRLKGACRPVNNEDSRARVLSALKVVDDVVIFEEDTPEQLIQKLQPDLLVKGGDYEIQDIVGADFVQARGGEVHIVPLVDGESTTSTIERAQGKS